MKKTLLILNLLIIVITVFSQIDSSETIILQPNAKDGKDCYIFYLPVQNGRFGATNTTNYGDGYLAAMEWTWDGDVGSMRTLIEFDLSKIPRNSKIVCARLSLYFNEQNLSYNNKNYEKHSTLSGSNECWIARITSEWDEQKVTWNTQPNVTTKNRVLLPASERSMQDYENINVTQLVQDMINEPEGSFGFMLYMKKKQHYRSMFFAASDHENKERHPKLVITYEGNLNSNNPKSMEAAKENNQYETNSKTPIESNLLTLIILDSNNEIVSKHSEITLLNLNTITENLPVGEYLFMIIDENKNVNSFQVIK